ncbi:MAG: class I SAM-dependent methyltransferase [Magnetococcales bacterium]|nr:class I SAM-dependent methyltransferase [Magnetococcales bacterium]MBF0156170.1 class I SAM-dependent methyltransferase [Magnetococcales bacterium]
MGERGPDRTIEDVRRFWEENPLFGGESKHPRGSREFFEEHRRTCLEDVYAGEFDRRFFPPEENREGVLDLGCGPGFWPIELWERGCREITIADLTETALALAEVRCGLYGVPVTASLQNAEKLTFADASFRHVNCQGVIHHTPETAAAVAEIARVLRPGGTASISVYYRNLFLRHWDLLRGIGRLLDRLGGGLRGRGREGIFAVTEVDEIVRLYDGRENPIGKSFTREQFVSLLSPHFEVLEVFFHFFPARALPFRVPRALHKFLDRNVGFMIFATVRKPR